MSMMGNAEDLPTLEQINFDLKPIKNLLEIEIQQNNIENHTENEEIHLEETQTLQDDVKFHPDIENEEIYEFRANFNEERQNKMSESLPVFSETVSLDVSFFDPSLQVWMKLSLKQSLILQFLRLVSFLSKRRVKSL